MKAWDRTDALVHVQENTYINMIYVDTNMTNETESGL